jgi:dipeptidyl aminopeptidase/acylaminoacyl peptidase
MLPFRKIVYILASLLFAACSAIPAKAPEASTQSDAPTPKQPAAKPGTLAASIPVAIWESASEGHLLVPIDPANGQALADYEPISIDPTSGKALTDYKPISLGQAISHAFSPDLHTLAVVGFASSEFPSGGSLHLIDLSTWEGQVQELQLDGYVNAMDFSPDGKQLAISHGDTTGQVLIFDTSKPFVKAKSAVRQNSMDFFIYNMKFTSDGNGLMVYGSQIENRYTVNEMSPNPPIVALLDSADLSVRWKTLLKGVRHGVVPKDESGDVSADLHQPGQAIYLYPGLAFAPGQDILYVVHPDEDKLTTVDFGAQKVSTVQIKPQLSWFERLLSLTAGVAHAKIAEGTSKQAVASQDGQFLYIVGQRNDLIQDKNGNWQMIENPLGLQIVRAKDGSRMAYYDTEASELSISPDGRYLYLRGWGETQDGAWTQVFDTSTNQAIAHMDGMWLVPTRRANGAPVLASSVWMNDERDYQNAIVDSRSVLAEWVSPDYLAWLQTR